MGDQLLLVASRRLEHPDRIPKLLAGAFQLAKRGVHAAVGTFALQPAQAPTRIAEGLAGTFQVVGQRAELVGAGLLIRRTLLCRCLLDVEAFLGGEIHAVADLGHQRSLANRQRLEVGVETDGLGTRAGVGHLGEKPAQLVAYAALIVDQPVEARFELVALVELVG